jgi:hypothetical protein
MAGEAVWRLCVRVKYVKYGIMSEYDLNIVHNSVYN